MDSKKLEILMTAVDLGSFSKASEVVGYTQSGLTHLVDSLEREIGFPLIRRSYSGIALTEAGRAEARRLSELLDRVSREALCGLTAEERARMLRLCDVITGNLRAGERAGEEEETC